MKTKIHKERLVAFLYRLIRDDIVSGKVENHMIQVEQQSKNYKWEYSNKDLESYCRKLVDRLI
jgi:hypothetical protein